jgi:prepilin signal peptidase PulO-like enzyme (type II secretory pathway)
MSAGLLLSLLLGWLVGGAANWAADHLPGYPATPLRFIPADWPHYWTLSWIWRRDICPHCAAARPWRAPLLEAAMAAVFALTWLRLHASPVLMVVGWLYTVFLLVVLVIDLEHHRVLNVMTLPAALAALAFSLLPGAPTPLDALLGGAVGLGLFLVIFVIGRGKLGAGDVKLAGVIGLMTGYPYVTIALLAGVVLGGVVALGLLALRCATRKSYMAYAPYLAMGALIALWQSWGP